MDIVIVLIAGACFGSFVTMASYRLPRDEEIVKTPSHCPSCNHKLGARDLVPILSWLMHRARCSYCRNPVSVRYPLTELATALLFMLIYICFGFTGESVLLSLLAVCLMIMIVVDFEHGIIPDEVQVAIGILGVAYHFVMQTPIIEAAAGLAAGLAVGYGLRYGYYIIKKREGLGMGDVKFLAVAGLWIGAAAMVPFLFLSGVFGVVTAIVWRILGKGEEFPFGPALAFSMLTCLLFPLVTHIFWNISHYVL